MEVVAELVARRRGQGGGSNQVTQARIQPARVGGHVAVPEMVAEAKVAVVPAAGPMVPLAVEQLAVVLQ